MPIRPGVWLAALCRGWRRIFPAEDAPSDPVSLYRQQGVDHDFTRWVFPGRCPDCGAQTLQAGPRGGAAVNRRCADCGQRWNTLWPSGHNRLGLIARIDKRGRS